MASTHVSALPDRIVSLRTHAGRKSAEVAQQFSSFTSHGLDHLDTVAHYAGQLAGVIALSDDARSCLMAACYTHDLGMAHSAAQEEFGLAAQHQVRRWHARLSGDYIRTQLDPDLFGGEGLRDVVAQISEGHGRWDWDHPDFDERYGVDVRLLTALLSLADVLDIRSERRVPREFRSADELLRYQPLQNPLSRLHWLRHYYAQQPSLKFTDGGRTLEITLFATVGMRSKDVEQPRPDGREVLIRELIQGEVTLLLEHPLFKEYLSPHFSVRLTGERGPWPSHVKLRSDPHRFVFPDELVETALSSGMVNPRTIELDGDTYYKLRIEPFIGPDDLQVSVSWLPSFGAQLGATADPHVREANRLIAELARHTWDYVLWPVRPYVERLLSDLAADGEAGVARRLLDVEACMTSILEGRFRKYYIAIDLALEPMTSTRHVAKYGKYLGFLSKDNFLGGAIHLRTREQAASYITTCQTVAERLGLERGPAEDIPNRLKLAASNRTAYEVSMCSLAAVLASLSKKARAQPAPDSFLTFLDELRARVEGQSESFREAVHALPTIDPVISPMEEGWLEAVLELERSSSDYPWTDGEGFRPHIATGHAFVMHLKKRAVGYLIVSPRQGGLLLVKMAVHPAYRRRGYASRILQHVEDLARRQRHAFVELHVRQSNSAAITLYERFGFQVASTIPGYYQKTGQSDADRTAILMRRLLPPPA